MKEPIREPCDWWWHGLVPTNSRNGAKVTAIKTKRGTFCNNKKSENYLSQICSPETREICPNYSMIRDG